jgi:hypothetical protein
MIFKGKRQKVKGKKGHDKHFFAAPRSEEIIHVRVGMRSYMQARFMPPLEVVSNLRRLEIKMLVGIWVSG